MMPHRSSGESPFFILHGKDPNHPSAVIPNERVSSYSMDKSFDDYKSRLCNRLNTSHDRVKKIQGDEWISQNIRRKKTECTYCFLMKKP